MDGRPYLETTEPAGDDKNSPSGSYTSPNGGTGKLHLTWTVPFEPGTLTAIATAGGRRGGPRRLVTAGPPHAVTLSAEPRGEGAMAFVTASVVDAHGVVVPGAEPVLRFAVRGPGRIAGVDNGRQELAQGYQQPTIPAFHGQAVAVVAATGGRGPITVTASAPGLSPGRITVPGTNLGQRNGPGARAVERPDSPAFAAADASYSGAPDTLPAAMLDGDPATGWSNFYVKQATATLPAVSRPRAQDWVSLAWPAARRLSAITANFVLDATHGRPDGVDVACRTARGWEPVRNLKVTWGSGSNDPTTLEFDPATTTEVRVTMTARTFLRISALTARE